MPPEVPPLVPVLLDAPVPLPPLALPLAPMPAVPPALLLVSVEVLPDMPPVPLVELLLAPPPGSLELAPVEGGGVTIVSSFLVHAVADNARPTAIAINNWFFI